MYDQSYPTTKECHHKYGTNNNGGGGDIGRVVCLCVDMEGNVNKPGCAACNEEMGRVLALSLHKLMYCKNSRCGFFGMVTVVGVELEIKDDAISGSVSGAI